MTFYQELQLSSVGSKQLIHSTTDKKEKRTDTKIRRGRRRCRCCGDHSDSCSPDRACHYFQRAVDRTGAEHSFKDRQTE